MTSMLGSLEKATESYRRPGRSRQYSDSLRTGLSADRIPMEERFFVPSRRAPRPTQPLLNRHLFFSGGKAAGDAKHASPSDAGL